MAVLWIVLAIAVGSNAAVLCKGSCHPRNVATNGCHHQGATPFPLLSGDDTCNDAGLSVSAFIQENVRRAVSDRHSENEAALTRHRFAPSTTLAPAGADAVRGWSLETLPFETALRI